MSARNGQSAGASAELKRNDAALPAMTEWLPLLQESLAQQGRFRWRLRGTSMTPTLPSDCEVEIVPPGEPIPLGTLIVFASGPSLVVHRLVHRTRTYWVTQGDERRQPDPRLTPNQVLGVIAAAYLDGARCWPGRFSRPAALFWIARAYGLWMGRRIRRLLG